jgi:hypothetical protein
VFLPLAVSRGEVMDDDKTIIEKFTDAVKGAASTLMDAASNAAGGTMEATAKKISPREEQFAASEAQIYIPEATDAAAVPPPLFPIRKKRTARRSKRPAKAKAVTGAKKASAKKSTKKSSKKSPKKSAEKKTAKRPAKAAKKNKTKRG